MERFRFSMTLDRAEQIFQTVVAATTPQPRPIVRPLSDLGVCSFDEITIAMKLRLACEYQHCASDPSAAADFPKRVETYDVFSLGLRSAFVPDAKFAKLAQFRPGSEEAKMEAICLASSCRDKSDPEYQNWLNQETIPSFANFCRHTGADDPLYWQKVYSHLGLQYGPSSPRGNRVTPSYTPGARTLKVEKQNKVSTSQSAGCASSILSALVVVLFFILMVAFL